MVGKAFSVWKLGNHPQNLNIYLVTHSEKYRKGKDEKNLFKVVKLDREIFAFYQSF